MQVCPCLHNCIAFWSWKDLSFLFNSKKHGSGWFYCFGPFSFLIQNYCLSLFTLVLASLEIWRRRSHLFLWKLMQWYYIGPTIGLLRVAQSICLHGLSNEHFRATSLSAIKSCCRQGNNCVNWRLIFRVIHNVRWWDTVSTGEWLLIAAFLCRCCIVSADQSISSHRVLSNCEHFFGIFEECHGQLWRGMQAPASMVPVHEMCSVLSNCRNFL